MSLPGIGIFTLDKSGVLPDVNDRNQHPTPNAVQFQNANIVAAEKELISFICEQTGKIKPLAISDLDSYLNLGTEMPETYRFQGSKGILEMTEFGLSYTPQSGKDTAPSYYTGSFPRAMREAYEKQWRAENLPKIGQEPMPEAVTFKGPDFDDVRPHLMTFFDAVRSRKPVVEDAVFGHHAALACHMANDSYFRQKAVQWNASAQKIES